MSETTSRHAATGTSSQFGHGAHSQSIQSVPQGQTLWTGDSHVAAGTSASGTTSWATAVPRGARHMACRQTRTGVDLISAVDVRRPRDLDADEIAAAARLGGAITHGATRRVRCAKRHADGGTARQPGRYWALWHGALQDVHWHCVRCVARKRPFGGALAMPVQCCANDSP